MKLYEISIENSLDYEDYDHDSKLIVANGDTEAEIRAENWMKERYHSISYAQPSFSFRAITEVDGFKISVDR